MSEVNSPAVEKAMARFHKRRAEVLRAELEHEKNNRDNLREELEAANGLLRRVRTTYDLVTQSIENEHFEWGEANRLLRLLSEDISKHLEDTK